MRERSGDEQDEEAAGEATTCLLCLLSPCLTLPVHPPLQAFTVPYVWLSNVEGKILGLFTSKHRTWQTEQEIELPRCKAYVGQNRPHSYDGGIDPSH